MADQKVPVPVKSENPQEQICIKQENVADIQEYEHSLNSGAINPPLPHLPLTILTESPDAFQLRFYKNRSGGHVQKLVTMFKREDSILRFNHCQIDLRKGCVMFDVQTDDMPQYIALTFAIGILHVLCVPRPTTWKPGEPVDTENTTHVRSRDLPFVLASGLNIMTPCNYYRSRQK
ncbi:hypothetical protein KUTeg_021081 [Tegillarca granosa]|uniref:Uncharacterized protein n=1 Tax=Tegillarca granosa TaxID=220873 RepID=A0ABQ9E9R2_TEGGR|nr:hypothetical protein KUTeg_021081 [Tegillarca granosa]